MLCLLPTLKKCKKIKNKKNRSFESKVVTVLALKNQKIKSSNDYKKLRKNSLGKHADKWADSKIKKMNQLSQLE